MIKEPPTSDRVWTAARKSLLLTSFLFGFAMTLLFLIIEVSKWFTLVIPFIIVWFIVFLYYNNRLEYLPRERW